MAELAPVTCPSVIPRHHRFHLRREYFGLALILIVGLLLRCQHLADVHSWFDESLGWRMAQFSASEIIARSELNVHPPAHFLLLRCWAAVFGGSVLALRCYSLVWGGLTVLGAFVLARAATKSSKHPSGSSHSALLAALLVAISPLHVAWSQQIKMYTLGTCLAVWSSWLLITWFDQPRRWKLVLYVPLAGALTLQHHYGAFTVFAQLTYALGWSAWNWGKKNDTTSLLSMVITSWATTSIWLLWLPSFLIQRNLVRESYWISNFSWQPIINVWSDLFFASDHFQASPELNWLLFEVVSCTILVLLARKAAALRWIGWLVLAPYLLAIGWSFALHNVLASRFLIFAQVFALVGLAALVGTITSRGLRWTLTAVLLSAFAWAAHNRWMERNADAAVPGMPVLVRTLQEVRSENELVLVCNPMLYLNLQVHGSELPNVFAFDPGSGFPHFQGTPVMRDSEYYTAGTLANSTQTWVWTVDADQWLGGSWRVQLGPKWKLQQERSLREWYGTLVIRAYQRESSEEVKQPQK